MTTLADRLAQAVGHLNAGRHADAEAALAAASRLDPAPRGVNFLRGRCRLLARDFAAAARFFNAELALDPANLPATLRPLMASSPLCDGARFARDFAVLLRRISRR
jgi:hypothetical protein